MHAGAELVIIAGHHFPDSGKTFRDNEINSKTAMEFP